MSLSKSRRRPLLWWSSKRRVYDPEASQDRKGSKGKPRREERAIYTSAKDVRPICKTIFMSKRGMINDVQLCQVNLAFCLSLDTGAWVVKDAKRSCRTVDMDVDWHRRGWTGWFGWTKHKGKYTKVYGAAEKELSQVYPWNSVVSTTSAEPV